MPTVDVEAYKYSRLRISLFDVEVQAVAAGRVVYFPLKHLCEVIGLASNMQLKRLQADGRFADALRELPIPTARGQRIPVCIKKVSVATWLASVDTTKCSLAARGPIERFQEELFAAADRWLFGDTSDVVRDSTRPFTFPISGTLRLGPCPRCGLHLCLEVDDGVGHLVAEAGE